MSLKLESLEESIRVCADRVTTTHLPLFYYAPDIMNCSRELERVRPKLISNLYGPRTKTKIQELLVLWETRIATRIKIPPSGLDMPGLILWTLSTCGFVTPKDDLNESMPVCFKNETFTLTRVAVQSVANVFYLDGFEFILTSTQFQNGYLNVPLRFYLACIHPLIYRSRPLTSLGDIPTESLVEVAKFLDLETLPELIQTNSSIKSVCDSESIWRNILDNITRYTSAKSTVSLGDSNEPSKALVRSVLESQQKRRMMRFAQTMDVSDWASPFEFLSPTASVDRRRRYHRLDDMIL